MYRMSAQMRGSLSLSRCSSLVNVHVYHTSSKVLLLQQPKIGTDQHGKILVVEGMLACIWHDAHMPQGCPVYMDGVSFGACSFPSTPVNVDGVLNYDWPKVSGPRVLSATVAHRAFFY